MAKEVNELKEFVNTQNELYQAQLEKRKDQIDQLRIELAKRKDRLKALASQ